MSKFTGRLSYKDWCITKHLIAHSVSARESVLKVLEGAEISYEQVASKLNMAKELEEERKVLEKVTAIVDGIQATIGKESNHGEA